MGIPKFVLVIAQKVAQEVTVRVIPKTTLETT